MDGTGLASVLLAAVPALLREAVDICHRLGTQTGLTPDCLCFQLQWASRARRPPRPMAHSPGATAQGRHSGTGGLYQGLSPLPRDLVKGPTALCPHRLLPDPGPH